MLTSEYIELNTRKSMCTRAHVSFAMSEISPANAVEVDCVVFGELAISITVNHSFCYSVRS